MKYKKGTQAMLDAAKYDATLLPFNTVFITNNVVESSPHDMPSGVNVVRHPEHGGNASSVAFFSSDMDDFWFLDANDLIPAKKSKLKKWQNGTQAQLDAAKDDARLIPKKTYFFRKENDGFIYNRADCQDDTKERVLMIAIGGIVESSFWDSAGDLHV